MPVTHLAFALVFQLVIGLATDNWWAGAAFGAAFYLGREHAQAEYRWIERFGLGKRANMPLFGGLDPRVWNLKSLGDCLLPLLLVSTLALVL